MQITKRRIREIVLEEMDSFLTEQESTPEAVFGELISSLVEGIETIKDIDLLESVQQRLEQLADFAEDRKELIYHGEEVSSESMPED